MDDFNDRVRRRAYHIWLEEGRPDGREAAHWEMARELVAIEDQQKQTTKPVRRDPHNPDTAAPARAEPAKPAASMGEVPTLTDAGEQTYPPRRAATPAPAQPVAKPAAPPAAKPAAKSAAKSAAPAKANPPPKPAAKPASSTAARPATAKSAGAKRSPDKGARKPKS